MQRYQSLLLCAFVGAPATILGMCLLLGWNEQRAVCDVRAIAEGKDVAADAGCDSAESAHGQLAMFTCDLQKDRLETISVDRDFLGLMSFQGVGFETTAEVYQCIETKTTTTSRRNGESFQTTKYSYAMGWSARVENSLAFSQKNSPSFQTNCGEENPTSWPDGVPESATHFADKASIGPFSVPRQGFLENIAIETGLEASSMPAGWAWDASRREYWRVASWHPDPNATEDHLGKARVRFRGNDWSKPACTVLGLNAGGTISKWTASDSWLCEGFTLGDLREGKVSSDELFASLEAASNALTWIIRLAAFVCMWMSCFFICKPLEVAAECIPFVGGCLGDAIGLIVCATTCPLACACACGVAGVIWIVMRPVAGAFMLLFFCFGISAAIAWKVYVDMRREDRELQGHRVNGELTAAKIGAGVKLPDTE